MLNFALTSAFSSASKVSLVGLNPVLKDPKHIFKALLPRQAMNVGKAPLVALEASHRNALRVNSIEEMSSP